MVDVLEDTNYCVIYIVSRISVVFHQGSLIGDGVSTVSACSLCGDSHVFCVRVHRHLLVEYVRENHKCSSVTNVRLFFSLSLFLPISLN